MRSADEKKMLTVKIKASTDVCLLGLVEEDVRWRLVQKHLQQKSVRRKESVKRLRAKKEASKHGKDLVRSNPPVDRVNDNTPKSSAVGRSGIDRFQGRQVCSFVCRKVGRFAVLCVGR